MAYSGYYACRMLISCWRAPVAMSWWDCLGQKVDCRSLLLERPPLLPVSRLSLSHARVSVCVWCCSLLN